MKLSVVVVAFNIPREIERTLFSLSTAYQRDISKDDYEIIVIDNGSTPPVDSASFSNLEGNFRFVRIDHASPSPANAINTGLNLASGECLGVMIDGARIASPRLLSLASHGVQLFPDGVTGALGWYLGFDYQRNAALSGYNQEMEDRLLETVDWRTDGYELFSISTPDESSRDGWFSPIAELNAVFMHRERWRRLGGFDERFDLPGGGLVNLDLYARAVEEPATSLVLLVGEATFHQFHHGIATNSLADKALADWDLWESQYHVIRGKPYELPRLARPPVYLGAISPQMKEQFVRAAILPAPDYKAALDTGQTLNALEALLLPLEAGGDARLNQALQLIRQQIRLNRYATVAALCRLVRQKYPSHKGNLKLLSKVAPWVPHSGRHDPKQAVEIEPVLKAMESILSKGSHGPLAERCNPLDASGAPGKPSGIQSVSASEFVLADSMLMEPLHMSFSAPWAGHIPFASWLISIQRPGVFVELGSFLGISYLAFCQAIAAQNVTAQTFAIDTWEGDAHTGSYDENVFETIRRNHDPLYADFSRLLRMTFDDALPLFEEGSVDLLHIDGLHTYEAVRHDFLTWLPKISTRGIVLFHDIAVHHGDFGVHRFWAEICVQYPSFSFEHSNGLGVLLVGSEQPEVLRHLSSSDAQASTGLRTAQQLFSTLGARLERQAEVLTLEQHLKDSRELVDDLTQGGQRRHEWIVRLDDQLLQKQRELDLLDKALKEHQGLLSDSEALLRQRTTQLNQLLNSRSWKITAPFRWMISKSRRARNALRYVKRGQWQALWGRMSSYARERVPLDNRSGSMLSEKHVGVLTPPHTLFLAHAIAKALTRAGYQIDILSETPPQGYVHGLYFVICPQVFRQLPPGERRIAIQMEQAVSERWFTRDYVQALENSLAVFDYAQFNLQVLEGKGVRYPHTYLVPVGAISKYGEYLANNGMSSDEADGKCDVLFYGDASAPRRQLLLGEIGKHYRLRIERNLFGPALHRAIAGAKVVVNIHYYEGALVESTRLYESLSLGATIVSEVGADQDDYEHLKDVIQFVPVGDLQAILDAIAKAITSPRGSHDLAEFTTKSELDFQFMFFRALQGLHLIGPGQFSTLVSDYKLPGNRLALSLPETTLRRQLYASARPPHVEIFDGLRRSPGWVGCAMSYQFLARKALEHNFPYLEVMEDDVLLPSDYERRLAIVSSYLDGHEGEWDIFAGLITILSPDTQVLGVEVINDLTFVTLNRFTGCVHNRYAPSALRLLSHWDGNNADSSVNTIDKYLEATAGLRVVTTLPYLVAHREDAHSSLWGFSNTQYSELIANTELEVRRLVSEHLSQVARADRVPQT
ncbi:MAG: class I SAM-dependent methyltransferase [Ramlibacter sp.]